MTFRQTLIGHVAVDSGQIIIVDPCYLGEWKDGDVKFEDGKVQNAEDNHYARACEATTGEQGSGEIVVAGIAGTGVASQTNYGDGTYPVYAEYDNNGRPTRLIIDFLAD